MARLAELVWVVVLMLLILLVVQLVMKGCSDGVA